MNQLRNLQELDEPDIDIAAASLVRARLNGVRLPSLPSLHLPTNLAQGFAIQRRVGGLAGKIVGGWKCALPPSGKWIVAPIYSDSIVTEERYRLSPDATRARIEPELACVLASDLPPRADPYTGAEIACAIDSVHLALEVIDCRYIDPNAVTFEQLLADGLFNHGLVLGDTVALQSAANMPRQLRIVLSDQTDELADVDGRHPDGDPLLPIVWLANFLSLHGIGLSAGQVIITGSYAGVLDVPVNRHLKVRFGDAGLLPVYFSTTEQ